MKNEGFSNAVLRAGKMYKNTAKVIRLLSAASDKTVNKTIDNKSFIDNIRITISMVTAIMRGEFSLQTRTVIYLIASLIYFVNPLDLIPDFIVGLGYVDDATVIAFVLKNLKKEMAGFQQSQEIEVVS